jgi:drug/metabolite transporter (DMT)-like permease
VRRWAAIGIGLAGVIVMMRPGTSTFQLTSLLPLISAVFYAAMHTMTRRIGNTESALTMAFYIQITFVAVSIGFGLAVGDGRFAAQDNASLAFLLRGWEWPPLRDLPIFLLIGVAIAIGGFFISQAYRVATAATVAPFEYIALPLAIVWGIAVFGEWPDAIALVGMAMIIGSGLFTIWREAQAGVARRGPKLRR